MPRSPTQPHHRLRALHDACKRIGVLDDEPSIVAEALASAREAFNVERAVLLLRGDAGEPMKPYLDPIAARPPPAVNVGNVDTTCIVAHGRALTIAEVTPSQDDAYGGFAFAPLEIRGAVIGLLGVSCPADLPPIELELLCGLASVAAVTIHQARTHVEALEESRRRSRLSRYFSPQVASYLASNPHVGNGTSMDVTVLMCDMRGFTAFSDRQAPETVLETLNRYLAEMIMTVLAHGGMIDKLLGDGVLGVFGAPLRSVDHAGDAARCALAMTDRARTIMLPPRDAGGPPTPVRVGVGLASGPVILGDVGGGGVLDFTVLGSTVNLASRVESATKTLGRPIVLTERTRQLLGDDASCEDLGAHPIRGFSAPQRLFALQTVAAGRAGTGPSQAGAHASSIDGTALA